MGGHRPAVGIGQRYLVLAGSFEIRQHHPVTVAFLAERLDLLGQVFHARAAARSAFLDIALVQPPQIVGQPPVGRADEILQRVPREVAILVVDRLDPGSVHRQQLASVEVKPPAKQRELTEHGPEGCAIVAPKVGDGLEVRLQAPEQPDQLDETVDDYVDADNPVRFIDAFVDELDLSAAGFVRVAAKATGRPGYSPADLLKLYIYGYLNRGRSSRRLETESHRNIELIWLLRSLKPDFKTIADFRRDNRGAFRSVFREFALLCRRLDLYGRELLAVDGTRIKAVNNKDRNFTRNSLQDFIRAADGRLADYLRRLDEGDVEEGGTGGGARMKNLAEKIEALRQKRDRYGVMLADLERTGENQISLTDPDSRAMAAHTRVGVGSDRGRREEQDGRRASRD